jgi:putative transposase
MKLHRAYRFCLDPTPKQEQRLRQFAGCRRFVWNWALERMCAVYQDTGQALSYGELAAELVQLKQQPQTVFLQACDSPALQQTRATWSGRSSASSKAGPTSRFG